MIPDWLTRQRKFQIRRRARGVCERCGVTPISGYHSSAYCVPCLLYYRLIMRAKMT